MLAHASLRSLGPVQGGSHTVVRALFGALGPDGTLVVPTFTPENSDTCSRRGRSPNSATGCPRSTAGVPAVRSDHPQTSFAAVGPRSHQIISGHAPDCHLGERSPLARLYLDVALDDSDFAALGESFERRASVRTGRVGRATARVFAVRDAVDYAVTWLAPHRRR